MALHIKLLLLFTLALLMQVEGDELYDDKTDLIKLTQSNFESLVAKTNDMWLIEFYGI